MKYLSYELGTVLVELTRRCNMRCAHCLRGEPENVDMSEDVMDALVRRLAAAPGVGTVCFGGGECTASPKAFGKLVSKIVDAGLTVGKFAMVTNAKRMTPAFVSAVELAVTLADFEIAVSSDNMHERGQLGAEDLREKLVGARHALPGGHAYEASVYEKGTHHYDYHSVVKMGRGAGIGGEHPVIVSAMQVRQSDEIPAMCETVVYVDANGGVWPSCDFSYEYMRKHPEMMIGSVLDEDFDWYVAAVEFNVRNGSILPAAAVEPGSEGSYTSAIRGYWYDMSREQVDAARELADEMGIKAGE